MVAEAITSPHPAADAPDTVVMTDLGHDCERQNNHTDAEWATMVEAAVAIRNSMGQDADSERVTQKLAVRFPSVNLFELRMCVASSNCLPAADQARTPITSQSAEGAPAAQIHAVLAEGPLTGPADPRLPVSQFRHNLLPKQALDRGEILIPKPLAWMWLFSASQLPVHEVELPERNIHVTVGGNGHASLTVHHLSLMMSLYAQAQKQGLPHVTYLGRSHLKLTATFPDLYRDFGPDGPYGGSARKRIERLLEDLVNTPIAIHYREAGKGINVPFLSHVQINRLPGRTEVVCILNAHWSEPFLQATAHHLKPFLLDIFRHIPGDVSKLVYLALDYMIARNGYTELRLSTILERLGAFHEAHCTAPELRRSPARQAARLSCLECLDGLPMSNGGTVTLARDVAQGRHDRTKQEYKLIFTCKADALTEQQKNRQTLQRVVSIALYQRARARRMQRSRSKRRAEQLDQARQRLASP